MRTRTASGLPKGVHKAQLVVLLALTMLTLTSRAVAMDTGDGPQTRLLVVSGLGGDDRFSDAFHDWSVSLLDAGVANGIAAESMSYLGEDPSRERVNGKSSKEAVTAALEELRESSREQDVTWIVLIGHGSFRDGLSRLNLPGPDLTDRDFSKLLEGFEGKVVFVNTASASGGFLKSLSAENRVVVTATKTPSQRNESVFGGKFVAAFSENLADGDQNGKVSVLEAFDYAKQEVERHYESKNLLVTEQALLDDDGDGEGSNEPSSLGGSEASSDGMLAARLDFGASSSAGASGDLAVQRAALQDRLDQLRRQKSDLSEEIYQAELEALLIEIATLDRRIRDQSEGEGGQNR